MPGILEQRLAEKKAERQGVQPESSGRPAERKRPKKPSDETQTRKQKAVNEFSKPKEEEPSHENKLQEELDATPLTEEDIQELEQLEAMMSHENAVKSAKRHKAARRISYGILSAACVYLTMLIYGTLVTEFRYNDAGEIAPVVLSIQDIADRNEFTTVIGYYLQCRQLYEQVLTLDYRLTTGTEDSMAIAPEYEKAIDTVDKLKVNLEAANVDSKYNQLIVMLHTWDNTDMFNYCQYMSQAITRNDSNAATEAIAARQYVNDDFQLITKNIITLGNEIKDYDLEDIKDWSPTGYIQEQYLGIEENN